MQIAKHVSIPYVVIAVFLCLAAISYSGFGDTEQWLWCAAAVAWGPILLLLVAVWLS